MRIESTNSLREDFWPTYDELNEVNQRIDNVENDLDLLNINVISNDTEIRESINSLKNSYNEQIITNTLNTNELNANYADINSLNVNNIISDNVYIENLTVNRTVFDLALNTTHMENTTSLNGNFYSPNIIDPVISGNVIIDDADTITTNVFNANYATIDYLKINVNTPPIGSSAALGYDSEGHIIPIHATYDVGFPTDADYIFTDIFGTAFAGVSEVQVGPSDNLIQAHAVQNMYNELNESFNNFNNNFNDFNNTLNDFNNSLIDFGNNFNNSLNDLTNDVNNSFNDVNNSFNDVNNTIDILANGLENTNANVNELTSLLTVNVSGWTNSKVPVNIQGITSFEVSRFIPAAGGSTDIGNGAAMKVDGTACTLSIPGLFYEKENCSRLFNNCTLLNQNVQLPKGAVNCSETFYNCENLNQNIQIPNSVTNADHMFAVCSNLNQNILIPDSVTNVESMFQDCDNLNQNIAIPNSVISCDFMFDGCDVLNQNIQIPNSVTSTYGMFRKCINLNQNILIPNSVTSTGDMFGAGDASGCENLNQNILIPNSVTSTYGMFDGCVNLNQNIYVYSENIGTNCSDMFRYCDLLADKYIHIRSSIPLDTSNDFYNCLVNEETYINWTGRVINDLEEPTVWPPL